MANEFGADDGIGGPADEVARLTRASSRAAVTALDATLRAVQRDGREFAASALVASALEVRGIARRLQHTIQDLEKAAVAG